MTLTPTDEISRVVYELCTALTKDCEYHETRNPTWALAGAVRDRLRHAIGQIERLCAAEAKEDTP